MRAPVTTRPARHVEQGAKPPRMLLEQFETKQFHRPRTGADGSCDDVRVIHVSGKRG